MNERMKKKPPKRGTKYVHPAKWGSGRAKRYGRNPNPGRRDIAHRSLAKRKGRKNQKSSKKTCVEKED